MSVSPGDQLGHCFGIAEPRSGQPGATFTVCARCARCVEVDERALFWCRLTFEQLLRKLLGMPGYPAVLLLHWWSPYINRHAFFASSEDGINTIAAYYSA